MRRQAMIWPGKTFAAAQAIEWSPHMLTLVVQTVFFHISRSSPLGSIGIGSRTSMLRP
jgi:hypothetical protein